MYKDIAFYAYRYFIIANEQISFFQYMVDDKDKLVNDIFSSLEKNNKIVKILNERKHILYFKKKIRDNIYVCKLAKEKHYTKHEEGDRDIEDTQDLNYPFIYFIIDLRRHIILLQDKSSVFRHISTAKNTLCEWFTQDIKMYDYQFKIDEITYENVFWEYIEQSEEIYEVLLRMKSPNLFDGFLEANDILKKVRELLNNTETNIKFVNEKGKLKVKRNIFETFIKYITVGGGGEWRLKLLHKGEIKTPKSKENKKIVYLPKDDDNGLVINNEIIIVKLNEVEDVLGEGRSK